MSRSRTATLAVLLTALVTAAPCLGSARAEPQAGFSAATAAEASEIVEKARTVVEKMTRDDQVADLLTRSKGVFIVPNLLTGGLIVGGRGGEGVLLTHTEGTWSDPAFFDLGAITRGAQAGGPVGPLAILLMSEDAVRSFLEDHFEISASAGLSVFGCDAAARTDSRVGDIVIWSDQGGAFAGATIERHQRR